MSAPESWSAFLAERPLAVVSTVSSDGMPHAVPVEIVIHEGHAYVWCHRSSVKARNVIREGRAAIVAYKGHAFVLIRGKARMLEPDDPSYTAITQMFLDKYERTEAFGNDALIQITPDRIVKGTG